MKLSEIYRKSAKDIEDGNEYFACLAIMSNGGFVSDFEDIFKPRRLPASLPLGSGWYGPPRQETRDARILALCFMAAIMEAEGK